MVEGLRDPAGAAIAVGPFGLQKGLNPALDRAMSSRGNPIKPPAGQTFSGFLRACAIADLQAAGRYDEHAPLELRGEITESSLDTGMSKGTGVLAAHFTLLRDGTAVYDRTLRQTDGWDSSFVGAIAIPEAMNRYNALYGSLLATLWSDEAFRSASRRVPSP